MNAGRPTKYRESMCDDVIECGREGKTTTEMAAHLGIGRRTLYDWIDANEEFADAHSRALELAQAWWENKGRIATFGGCDGFNATSFIFNMKNRFREDWADRQQLEHTGKDGGPIETSDVTPREKLAEFLSAKSSGPTGDDTGE